MIAAVFAALLSSRGFAAQVLHLDLVADGRLDTVTLTQGGGAVTLRVDFANRVHRSQTFRFTVDSGREDAVCALPVHLEKERLSAAPMRGELGFAIVDERCDSLHFYWDRNQDKLTWWRL
jgi:hypothetical protein